jgi:alginate export protein
LLHRSTLTAALLLYVGCQGTASAQAEAQDRFSFSGTQRTRYESLDNVFRPNLSPSDQVLALQTSLYFDARLERLQIFAEIMDSRAELNDSGSFVNGTIVNSLEPIQAYLAWRFTGQLQAGSESTVRVGRMTLDLGKRRMLARNRFRNTVNNFVGADWNWRGADGRNARALYFEPMRALPSDLDGLLDNELEIDRATRGAGLAGFYYQLPPFADKSVLELYVLDFDLDSTDLAATADLLSLGARAYRSPSPGAWNYEVEAVVQRGESGGTLAGVTRPDLEHRAYLLHAEIGYAFDAPWSPNLVFQYDLASGDEDPNDATIERFNTLFGARRFDFGPTDIYGAFARSNIDAPGMRLTFRPKPRWQCMLHYADFRLAEARDGWIGAGWRDTSGAAGKSVGRQLEGSFTWAAIENRLAVETGFAELSLGRFAEQTAGAAFRGDSTFFYAAVTTSF